ncbi:cell wall hydrolase/autolysin [Emticicia oligotrophica DSM 17448]|uniref:N-acetylmuramoyl-L-alanine amidase n=1 Tax=Emticicia oligotrophica (strain DSM 17448 / CIP 109782 / MTCC 6937 / GPTSA100-15) TaxID=929562 RepID=A0ABM5MYA0_EMTOG|nr:MULTISPECIES: N-acetylmuramoyl-L-alanine amidase [Emticicia]AFK02089.1 cell wall hydrolase/autolysin [Emticicia oligotrophica DSM 17448]
MLKNLKVLLILIFSLEIVHAQSGKIRTIVIDAGHGGKDPGTQHSKLREKDIALSVTLKLGKKIQEKLPDVKVIYTRKSDVFLPLHERAAIANRNKADLFICIHVNANPHSSKLSGSETYVMGLHKTEDNLALAMRENEVILMEDNYKKNYKGYDLSSPMANIMLANYQNAFMKESVKLASMVEKQMSKSGHRSRGVKQAGFQVLWQTAMPGIYVETGYLTNSTDKRILGSTDGQEKLAEAIFKAVKAYKESKERL